MSVRTDWSVTLTGKHIESGAALLLPSTEFGLPCCTLVRSQDRPVYGGAGLTPRCDTGAAVLLWHLRAGGFTLEFFKPGSSLPGFVMCMCHVAPASVKRPFVV